MATAEEPGATAPPTVRIVGIGNVLNSDDGLGPTLVARMRCRYRLPAGVELVDAGTPGPELIYELQDADVVIFIDAVSGPGSPGQLRAYDKLDIMNGALPQRLTPHDPGLQEALLRLEIEEGAPEQVFLLGVIPDSVETGTGLSPSVRGALPHLERSVCERLEDLGVALEERSEPLQDTPWWESRR